MGRIGRKRTNAFALIPNIEQIDLKEEAANSLI